MTAPDGTVLPVVLHTADGLRMTPRASGLDADPRHLVGAIEIPSDAYADRASNPALDAFVQDWMHGNPIARDHAQRHRPRLGDPLAETSAVHPGRLD